VLFTFYIAMWFEYYFTNFGMTGLPYGAHRILVMGDLLLMPFAALGLWAIADTLGRALTKGKKTISVNSRLFALALICLLTSLLATSALYEAYPREELMPYQPSTYMIEAVKYIDGDAPGRYVVLCDPITASVAMGFLGLDYGYGERARGAYGIPDPDYPLMSMHREMTIQPSVDKIDRAMRVYNASTGYFVAWMGHPNFETIVQQTARILPINRVFNSSRSGKDLSVPAHYPGAALVIFRYPAPLFEEPGPSVKIIFDDGDLTEYVETSFSYMVETDITPTLTLSGHTSYNITEYPMHWAFLDLRVNDDPREFDETSDTNQFVYVKGLEPKDVLTVKWQWNRHYPNALWREDSFKEGWRTHDVYVGTMVPTIITDGNILNMSYSFTPESYWYYYYIKPVNITATGNQSIIVRWRSDGPIAVISYYSGVGLTGGGSIVQICSESNDWTLTITEVPQNTKITYVLVGISNLEAQDLSGLRTLSVDYILISSTL